MPAGTPSTTVSRATPGGAGALIAHGEALLTAQRMHEAVAVFRRILAHSRNHPRAWVGLGSAWLGLAQPARALRCMREALARDPEDIQALVGEGVALQRLGRTGDALACYEQVLLMQPQLPGMEHNRGMALRKLRRHAEAADAFSRALALAEDFPYAHGNRLRSRLQTCDWRDYEAQVLKVRALVAAGRPGDDPFSFLVHTDEPAAQLACARQYVASNIPAAARSDYPGPGPDSGDGRIRLAYVSCEFREHANAFLTAGVFEAHDRSRFEVTGISYGRADDGAMRQRLRRGFDRFLDVREHSDHAVIATMRRLGIQIAVDLRGLSSDFRGGLFAGRAAPVQACLVGYPGSTGTGYLDYLFADHVVAPPGCERHFQEQLARLPDCYLACDDRRERPRSALPRTAFGLPDTGFVFCCFNSNHKITPAVFAAWMRLLRQLPDSVLWLLAADDGTRDNLCREAAAHGVDSGRLVFTPRVSPSEHLARHVHADLFLDTYPYTAHTTCSEALWCGVPVLTREGEGFAARVASSVLQAAGLPELVTRSLAEYEALALRLAREPERLAALRCRLAEPRRLRLFDTARYTRHLESAFEQMWRRHRAGEPPCAFDIPPAIG